MIHSDKSSQNRTQNRHFAVFTQATILTTRQEPFKEVLHRRSNKHIFLKEICIFLFTKRSRILSALSYVGHSSDGISAIYQPILNFIDAK